MEVGGQRKARLLHRGTETRYLLYRSQGRSGRGRKISPTAGFDHRTVQAVASRYTDWAMPVHISKIITDQNYSQEEIWLNSRKVS